MKMNCLRVLLLWCLYQSSAAIADEFRPALLEITETGQGWYSVMWKVPLQNGRPLRISPKFPEPFVQIGPASTRIIRGDSIEESVWSTDTGSLIGATIEIEGLTAIPVDVIVQIEMVDGSEHSAILRPASASFTVPDRVSKWMVASSYWKIGTIHILEGFDHLLFVLALLLIVSGIWPLLKAVTAFTVAHSITLALATLDIVHMPSSPTEAIIALSIVFLAGEIIHNHQGKTGITERWPWLIAFIFGLFHGLGFAGALSEVGVPQHAVPLALFMFNVGVETGQLLFIGVVITFLTLLRRIPITLPQGSWRLMPYSIGSIAAFWTIERVVSIFVQT